MCPWRPWRPPPRARSCRRPTAQYRRRRLPPLRRSSPRSRPVRAERERGGGGWSSAAALARGSASHCDTKTSLALLLDLDRKRHVGRITLLGGAGHLDLVFADRGV